MDSSPAPADSEKTEQPDTSGPEPFAFRFGSDFRPVREGLLVVFAIACAVTLYLRLWRAHFRVPWAYAGDGMDTLASVKSILSSGWNITTPRTGAPFTGTSVDFPSGGETIHYVTIKLLGYVLRSPALTDNAYYLLGYFLVGLVAFYVARYLGLRFWTAWLVAILYSFLPYHQVHNEIHVIRSAYYIVPLDVLVMLWLISWRTQLCSPTPSGSLQVRWRRVAFAAGICVVQGISDTNTSGFVICILAVLGLLLAIGHRARRPLLMAWGGALLVGGTLLVANLPYLITRLVDGPNLQALSRSLLDQDVYGLRWIFMVLPVENHWFAPFAHLTAKAHNAGDAAFSEPGQSLGVLGAVGLIAILLTSLANVTSGRDGGSLRRPLSRLGSIGIVSILLASVGGVGFLIAVFGFEDLRDWQRIVVIVGFLAYVATGLLVERLLDRVHLRWPNRRHQFLFANIAAPVALVLAILGVADQAPPAYVPQYASTAVTWDVDTAFFGRLESMVPSGSMIFEYPIMVFPENGPVNGLYDYSEFAAYIHTHTLKWSYGAIKGRQQGDWQSGTLSNLPIATQLAVLSAIGFHGICVFLNGYPGDGSAFQQQLTPLLGAPTLVSSDNRLAYYSLAPVTAKVDASLDPAQRHQLADAAALSGITEQYQTGAFSSATVVDGLNTQWVTQTAQITVTNSDRSTLEVQLSARISGNGPGQLTASGGGTTATVALDRSAPTELTQTLRLPTGSTTVTLRASAAAAAVGGFWYQIAGVEVAPAPVYQAECLFETGDTRPVGCPS